jgi:hypothetical protein
MRAAAGGLALALAAGIGLAALPGPRAEGASPPTVTSDSWIEIAWGTGEVRVGAAAKASAAEVAAVQPDHAALTSDGNGNDAGSGHWDDFKDLKITVSQTAGLIDQAITVTATGMRTTETGIANDKSGRNNFLQLFQCWGPPLGDGLAERCQWGGYSPLEIGGTLDDAVATMLLTASSVSRDGLSFKAVTGQENQTVVPPQGRSPNSGLAEFFTHANSNEVLLGPVSEIGSPISFVVQSAAAQPYLGCGDPTAGGERCWLVIVPRGQHSGSYAGTTGAADRCHPFAGDGIPYGAETPYGQAGSPISAKCSFWDDRLVIPLDFDNPRLTCPDGSAERRVVGSQLLSRALSSWQPRLCQESATFSFTTGSANLVRQQLLTGQASMAAVSSAATVDNIGLADPTLLEQSDLAYAPLVNSGMAIGFLMERRAADDGGGPVEDLKLTPRLLAKLLTQSYKYDVPQVSSTSAASESMDYLATDTVVVDPEWAALGNPVLQRQWGRCVWTAVGPQGDDLIQQLWRYVLADADAVAFLSGEPDPWGNTVNRYYLPPTHPSAAGGGYDLLNSPIDTMPKADQTIAPDQETAQELFRGLTVDSTSYSPYSGTFAENAVRILKADRRVTFVWDPNKFSGANVGFFVTGTPALPTERFGRLILGPVTGADARNYGLTAASLALPLTYKTTAENVAEAREFVAYSDESVAAAIAANQPDPSTGVAVTDPAALPSGAYPLAATVYAAVDLNAMGLDSEAREDYADLLEYAAGQGNIQDGVRGSLPLGYVPLTGSQAAAARSLAATLLTGAADDREESQQPASPNPGNGESPNSDGSGQHSNGDGNNALSANAQTSGFTQDNADPGNRTPLEDPIAVGSNTAITQTEAKTEAATAGAAPPARRTLGVLFAVGLAGVVAGPALLRRREAAP